MQLCFLPRGHIKNTTTPPHHTTTAPIHRNHPETSRNSVEAHTTAQPCGGTNTNLDKSCLHCLTLAGGPLQGVQATEAFGVFRAALCASVGGVTVGSVAFRPRPARRLGP
jgi:hypothetical protein